MAAMSRHNITLDPKVYDEFCRYASRYGIKTSSWVNQKMIEFIEEQKLLDELKEQRKHL